MRRRGVFGKLMEGLTSFSRINHRMHNKVWIADNRITIAGGRNIGDEYFTASDHVRTWIWWWPGRRCNAK